MVAECRAWMGGEGTGKTYSLTLCCKGCKKGPAPRGAGVLLSEMDVVGRWFREGEGLKRPGEDSGVLLAVLSGIEAD